MATRALIQFSGLAMVHLEEQSKGSFLGSVHLLAGCREANQHAPSPRVHIARMAFPLACLKKDGNFPKGTRTLLDTAGTILLEVNLHGAELTFGPDDGTGVTLPGTTPDRAGPTDRPDWKDLRYLLDLALLSGVRECDHERGRRLAPTRVRLDRGKLTGAEPRDPRMRDARWRVTDSEGTVREQPILDRVVLELEEDAASLDMRVTRDGEQDQVVLEAALDPIPVSIYALCDFAGFTFDEMDDVKQYEALLKNPRPITVPTRKPSSGTVSSSAHNCPPSGLIVRAEERAKQ